MLLKIMAFYFRLYWTKMGKNIVIATVLFCLTDMSRWSTDRINPHTFVCNSRMLCRSWQVWTCKQPGRSLRPFLISSQTNKKKSDFWIKTLSQLLTATGISHSRGRNANVSFSLTVDRAGVGFPTWLYPKRKLLSPLVLLTGPQP